jgi:hypothetical protein
VPSTVYSTSFAQAYNGAGVNYKVPAGYVAVLRTVTLVNRSSSATANLQLRINETNLIIFERILDAYAATSGNASVILDMHVVINAGQTLVGLASPGVDATLSGYLLTLP